ncbi:hypothetical protein KAR91_64725 [Candidatus Pacearchaeota archaeon]|nr:hypothetical protein [Candidatus Pacearchaeota archaeon]
MALVANATKISLDSTKLPSGYTDPGGSNLSSSQPSYENLALSVLKATVENATKATTFDNIRDDAAIGIEKQVADRLAADDIGSVATATYNIDWKEIRNNQIFAEDFYNDTAVSYICIVDVYINVS